MEPWALLKIEDMRVECCCDRCNFGLFEGSGSFKKHVRSCKGACEMCCHAQEKVVGANFEVLSLEIAVGVS